ncbi:kinase-like domain-containing protein [Glomus cerebriforme]|uniref:Kinase-like domain-containing protein n=1 Tax=Glomus cerebriforme TaxID=658196 RepID=A0A397SA37_9GLOM|nr:kinase-like domain-containing protein [Glomus cerebriforme]
MPDLKSVIENTPETVAAATELAGSLSSLGSNLDIAKATLGAVGTVGEAIKPFVPLIAVVTTVISEIISIYEDAQYNKKICNALMDRVQVAESAIKTLNRRKQENEKNFRDKKYYLTFVRFTDVMKKIKDFIKDISQLQGYKKFLHASNIKDKFENLTKEFETVMRDLHFTMAVENDEQREIDQKALKEDIAEMTKFLERIEGGITAGNNQINTVLQEVILIKNQIETFTDIKRSSLPIPESIKATTIEPNELTDPLGGKATDRRRKKEPYIVKKSWKFSIDVACIPTNIPEDNSMKAQNVQAKLAILGKLQDSPNILKFYGLSHIDNNLVMVVEWAELGNLREVYNKFDISWTAKVSIALGICRGITFLNSCKIYHHDIRCQNVMMTRYLEPKLTNFEYARLVTDNTVNVTNLTEIVHWLAPEKLRNASQPYNTKCEIFSFGMLLWELAFEKIPYENWDMNTIRDYVLDKKREKITFGKESPHIQKLQSDYAKIIVAAWQDDPQIRAGLQQIFLDLHAMYTEFCSSLVPTSPDLKPDKSLDLDGSKAAAAVPVSVSDEGGLELPAMEDFSIDAFEIMPLEEGIAAHKKKELQVAWDCFNAHADLGNTTAKYWKGYYLWEGYACQQDRVEASKLFKEAADDGLPDAQLRYAFSLVPGNPGNPGKFDKKVFIEYLTKAAGNNNSTAQFNLGDLYLNGKLNVTKDEELGIKYLRLAALANQPKAIEILRKKKINIYNEDKIPSQ